MTTEETLDAPKMIVESIALADIKYDEEFNCRGHIIPADVIDLAKSIEEHGLIAPVTVTQFGAGDKPYRLIAGYRRYKAHKVLKRSHIDCVINTTITNEVDAIAINFSENIARKELNLGEEAKTVQKMTELHGTSREKIAEKINKSPGWVQERLMLVNMGPDAIEAAGAGVIRIKDIRTMYTQFNRERKTYGEAKAFEAVATIIHDLKILQQSKDKKATADNVIAKNTAQIKKHRTRKEIFAMIDHVLDQMPAGLYSRSLAWCAGEITTEEFEDELARVAEKRDIKYVSVADREVY